MTTMTEWIVSSSLLILAVMLLRRLTRGKITFRLRYALWAVVLVRLLVPVNIGSAVFSVSSLTRQAAGTETGQIVSDITRMDLPRMTYSAARDQVAREYAQRGVDISALPADRYENVDYEIQYRMRGDWSLRDILKALWIAGAAAVGAAMVVSNAVFARNLRRTRRRFETDLSPVPVYVSPSVETPCLFGLFRPAVYLTESAAADETVLRHVLAHELTHRRHLDHVWAILRGACLALHWYNPLVWWAAALAREDSELACDEDTLRRLGEDQRAEYGRTLIGMTCEKRTDLLRTATTMTGSGKSIRERVLYIAKRPRTTVFALVLVALVAAVAVGCTFTGAGNGAEEPPADGLDSDIGARYDSMEDFAQKTMDSVKTVTYPDAQGNTVTAEVLDTKLAFLEKTGEVADLAPDGVLESWRFEYLVKIGADPEDVAAAGDVHYEEDGWLNTEGQGGHDVVALRHTDGAYEILMNSPAGDNSFLGVRDTYEEAIYDWYVTENGLGLPLFVEEWIDLVGPPEGVGLESLPARRFDGDGWTIYVPADNWSQTTESGYVPGRTQWTSVYGGGAETGSTLTIDVIYWSRDPIAAAEADGFIPAEGDWSVLSRDRGGVHDLYAFYPLRDGETGVRLWLHWDDADAAVSPYAAMEPQILELMRQSFTLTGGPGAAPVPDTQEIGEGPMGRTVTLELANPEAGQTGSLKLQLTNVADVRPGTSNDGGGVYPHDVYVLMDGAVLTVLDADTDGGAGRWNLSTATGEVPITDGMDPVAVTQDVLGITYRDGSVFSAEFQMEIRPATPDLLTAMQTVRPEDFVYIDAPNVTPEALARALNGAVETDGDTMTHYLTGEEAESRGYGMTYWSLEGAYLEGGPGTYADTDLHFRLDCGLTENIVEVTLSRRGLADSAFFEDETLYQLTRQVYDYEESVDENAFEQFRDLLVPRMEDTLAAMREESPCITGYELTRFAPAWGFDDPELGHVAVYRFNYALLTDDPDSVVWAGGMYLDSKLRVQGFSDGATDLAVRYEDGEPVRTVFLSDFYYDYDPEDAENLQWAVGRVTEALRG